MRVITLYQPYATALILTLADNTRPGVARPSVARPGVARLKANETRSWHHPKVTGTIGIAAAAKTPKWCKELIASEPYQTDLKGIYLPEGVIVGTVDIVSYQRSEEWMEQNMNPAMSPEQAWLAHREYRYGDYSPGRWIWKTKNPVQFVNPIPAKGSQGWWNFDLAILSLHIKS